MADDAAVIAELGRKLVLVENRNRELEEKARDMECTISNLQSTVSTLEELLDQALNANEGGDFDEEPEAVAVVRPWSAARREARECAQHTGTQPHHTSNAAAVAPTAAAPTVAAASTAATSGAAAVTANAAGPAAAAPAISADIIEAFNGFFNMVAEAESTATSTVQPSHTDHSAVYSAFSTQPVSVPASSSSISNGSSASHAVGQVNVESWTTTPTSCLEKSKALYRAATEGDANTVEHLLCAGANVNYKNQIGRDSPLHSAACYGHEDVLSLLLAFGARLNVINVNGYTPLHFAASWGHIVCLEKLIHVGARVNIANAEGDTPLHLAAEYGTEACVRALINAGAHTFVRNNDNLLPRDLANTIGIRNILWNL